jgi:AGCS family alanine or glycine:cation symporter
LSAVAVIVGGGIDGSGDYMMMTVNSYGAVLGEWAEYFIAVSVLLFALATVICWGHYGIESVRYISKGRNMRNVFIASYCLCILLGSVFTGELVWESTDLAIGVMTLINLSVILLKNGEVAKETQRYFGVGGKN